MSRLMMRSEPKANQNNLKVYESNFAFIHIATT